LAEKLRELGFELLVEIEGAVQEAAAGAPGAVSFQGGPGGGEDLRVMGEAEVVVRPHHDPLLALDHDDRVFGAGDRLEVRVETSSLDFARPGEILTLVEQRDVLQGLCTHAASVFWKAVVQLTPAVANWQG